MKYEILDVKTRKGVLIVTINRPKALNALNKQTFLELDDFFGKVVPRRKKAIGVIITGAGEKSFVAGADISEFTGLDSKKAAELSQFGHDVFNKIEELNKPVIAAVNGFALGGGCELALACHMRVASSTARLGFPEVNLGIIPGYGGTQRLPRYVGKGKALELMLTADMVKGPAALQLGLVNHVVEPEDLMKKCMEIMQKIGQKAPIAVSNVIESVNAYYDLDTEGFAVEVENFADCAKTKDFKEGARAFLEKRAPNFIGE